MKKAAVLFCMLLLFSGLATLRTSWAEETVQDVHNKMCPVMAGEAREDIFVDYQGKRYHFCCLSCVEEFNKNPEKYIEAAS